MQTANKKEIFLNSFNYVKGDPLQGWNDFLSEGDGFLSVGRNAFARQKGSFTPVILYNITCMAIEKLIMAALMSQGVLPCNHTMADLVQALESVFSTEITNDFKDGLLALDRHQEICEVNNITIREPEMEDIPAMLELAKKVSVLVHRQIKPAS